MKIKNTLPKEDFIDKKIYIVGIGYETAHKEIFRACDGWVGHVDGMIWGDGRFDFYPAENDYSENGWLDAAERRYKDVCDFIPYQYSGDQVTKRQMYLDLAGKAGADFAIAVDTDEYIDPAWSNFDRFYNNLITCSLITNDRMFYQWVYIPDEKLWPKQGNEFESNVWSRSAKIHKDPGTMRFCCDRHYIWTSKNITDEALYRWQMKHIDKPNPYEYAAVNTIDGVRIRMDRTLRTKEQNEKSAEWAFKNSHAENSRQFYKIEDIKGEHEPPFGCKTWAEFEAKPHTFNKEGKRIEL